MKKFVLAFVSFCIIFSLTGCGKSHDSRDRSTKTSMAEMEFSEYRWPTTEIAKRLTVPKSNIGKLSWSADYGFVLYVANTTLDDFNDYADECEKAGFMKNYRRGDDYFFGDDDDGYQVWLRFDEGNVMFVRIDEPEEDILDPAATSAIASEQVITEEDPKEPEPSKEDILVSTSTAVSTADQVVAKEDLKEPEPPTEDILDPASTSVVVSDQVVAKEDPKEPEPSKEDILVSTPTRVVTKEDPKESEPPKEDILDLTPKQEANKDDPKELEKVSDPFSDSKHKSTARRAFENYGKYVYPYGIKYHWLSGSTSKYEDNGVWYFKVKVTITNKYNAEKNMVAEGRVDFNEETVSEFNILPAWD